MTEHIVETQEYRVLARSESIAHLLGGLVIAQKAAGPVAKASRNEHHKYNYAAGEDVIGEARDALGEGGLALMPVEQRIIQSPSIDAAAGISGLLGRLRDDRKPRARDDREPLTLLDVEDQLADIRGRLAPDTVGVTYLLAHSSGEWMQLYSETPIIPEKGRPEDKALAGAKTYDLAYLLRALLLIPRVAKEGEVDQRDDNGYEPRRGGGQQRPRPQQPRQQPAPRNDSPASGRREQPQGQPQQRNAEPPPPAAKQEPAAKPEPVKEQTPAGGPKTEDGGTPGDRLDQARKKLMKICDDHGLRMAQLNAINQELHGTVTLRDLTMEQLTVTAARVRADAKADNAEAVKVLDEARTAQNGAR